MSGQGPPESAQLVDLARAEFILGCTAAGLAFAVPIFGSNVARLLRGGRQSLRGSLARQFAEALGKPPSASALTDALLVLEAEALEAAPRDLHLRVARDDERVILDLGREDGQVVAIAPGGWELLERSPVLFRRSELTDRLPMPERGGSLDALWALVNVAPLDRPLVLAWLVAALLEDIPHPILLLRGLQGAAKSTTARTLVSLVDPSAAPLRSLPADLDGWSVAASGSWVVGLDNVSHISEWQSDALCRAVTGDGLVKRRLYSDDSLAVLAFRRALMLTGIDVGALRGDLADRLLVIELYAIPSATRLQDADLAAAFRDGHPALLGALLDLAAEVLAALLGVQLRESPRMADFAKVLAAVDLVLGTEALARYSGQAAGLAVEVVESDPVAEALLLEFPPGQSWEGTVSALLEKISPERHPRGWPQSGRGLGGRLRRLAPSLSQVGLDIDFDREGHDRRRVVRLERVGPGSSAPSAPSAASSGAAQNADGRAPDADGRTAPVGPIRDQADGADGADGRIAAPLFGGPRRRAEPPQSDPDGAIDPLPLAALEAGPDAAGSLGWEDDE